MRVAIVGTGYVGLTTGVCLATVGHEVTCVDLMSERVDGINKGEAPFYEPGLAELILTVLAEKKFSATTDLSTAVGESEVILITVGTPQSDKGIDLSYVSAAAGEIGRALKGSTNYKTVVVKSTVVPGTTDTLVRNMLERESGLRAGEFGLCMNPEFLREGSAIDDFMNPDRIVIGQWDDKSGQALAEMYRSFDCSKVLTTNRNAEMIKYASNALLATLISFSNEVASICERTPETDIEVVMDGVHLDRRWSPIVNGERVTPGILSFLRAGCGFGGSCLPKDVNAFRAYAREQSVTPHLMDAVVAVNAQRPERLAMIAEGALGSLKGKTVAVLGIAFKTNTDDTRESPALALMQTLLSRGASVKAYDLMVRSLPSPQVELCQTPEEALSGADAAVVATGWPEFAEFDWERLCASMRNQVVIDGRNLLSKVSWPAGVRYFGIGRNGHNGQELNSADPSRRDAEKGS
jgi:UDPglucose 6-dehydrogenase/GDP-mannose 6-dehydrogenase